MSVATADVRGRNAGALYREGSIHRGKYEPETFLSNPHRRRGRGSYWRQSYAILGQKLPTDDQTHTGESPEFCL